jgi:hypothetical protein
MHERHTITPRAQASAPEAAPVVQVVEPIADIAARRRLREISDERPLQCVSSGYPAGGHRCNERIPCRVVTAAWDRRRRSGVRGNQLFHFSWRGEVWLAFGLEDGRIRGVYCPSHSAERDRRSLAEADGDGAPAIAVAVGA